ncbi:MAG TPA: hypothetical protein VMM79_00035 [Longimicrobiales bacterium]|nr:hypothetical protein [Longimicrobiales bacterium]
MRRDRCLRSSTALCLVALLGALGTGLPSHHHDDAPKPSDSLPGVSSADHHAHGTQLVDLDQRVPAAGVEFVAPAALTDLLFTIPVAAVDLPRSDVPRPMERAPPAVAPRAPPFPV